MKRAATIRMTLMLLAAAWAGGAEIIDRIAVSVGNRAITTSDLDREIRVTAFLNGTKPDFSQASREATANRLIEQKLIQLELESNRYEIPDAGQVQPLFEKFKKDHYRSEEEFRASLKEYGLTEEDVKAHLLWQRTLLLFIDTRFRPAVEVSEKDIAEYFEKEVVPTVRTATPGQSTTLADFRDRIEETLTGKRVDEQMNKWLEEARRRTRIQFQLEVLR